MIVKIGFGYDAHRFTSGNHIIIGGEKITFTQGIDAHSDGDVLLHAICDALLGAAGLGDIGQHFPDDDPAFKDIESTVLVQQVMRKLENKNYKRWQYGLHYRFGKAKTGSPYSQYANKYR